MIRLNMILEMRMPRQDGISHDEFFERALQLAEMADEFPVTTILLNEHHGSPDGYLASPFVFGAAVAARTKNARITVPAMPSIHSPIEMAEHAATLDLISGGRVDLLVLLGYRPSEFTLNGVSLKDRGARTDEGLRVLRAAFSGEPFDWQGNDVLISPRPVQRPGPPIWVGGGVPASARRAARWGDGFFPTPPSPELVELYREECRKLGREPGPVIADPVAPFALFISEDVEATWDQVGGPALHAVNTYNDWAQEAGAPNGFDESFDVAALRASGIVQVVTPDEALRIAETLEEGGHQFALNPLFGGVHPDVGLRSFELFAEKVLPHLDVHPPLMDHRAAPIPV